jgi:protease-4
MRIVVAALVALAAAGCMQGLRVRTQDRVRIESPVVTQSHIVNESPPVAACGPVVEMAVGGDDPAAAAKVAIIDVDGLLLNMDMTGLYSLGENPVDAFRQKLDAVAADPAVCAVVVRINSPGGGVTATDILWRDLRAFRERTGRPVVACLMDVGTGGAYYLATACDQIVAHPTTVTGGVGVILNLYNLRDTMGYFNVLPQAIKAGANIDMGTSAAALTPEARQLLQAMADEFHDRFRRVIEAARPNVDPAGGTTYDGRVFTAAQAQRRGLVDRIGYLDDAVAVARALAHCERTRVVLFHRPNDPAHSPYAVSPNVPLQNTLLPLSVPGLDRSRLPSFLYLWQPEATLEKLAGR